MNTKNTIHLISKILLLGYCSGVILVACSSDDEATQEPVQGEEAGDNAATKDTATDSASSSDDDQTMDDISAEGVIAEAEAIVNEGDATATPTGATTAESNAMPEADPSVTSLSGKTQSNEVALAKESTPVAIPVPNETENVSGPVESATGRVVRYVRSDKLSIRASATETAKAVGSLHRGDIVLVTYEGNWARLDNGTYLPGGALSTKGVGHKRQRNAWHSEAKAH